MNEAHEQFERHQRGLLVKRVTEILRDEAPFADTDLELIGDLSEAARHIVSNLDDDFAWGLLGREYADSGVTDLIFDLLEKVRGDFDRMMEGAHGKEAAEATKIQAEVALRRFIAENNLTLPDFPTQDDGEFEELTRGRFRPPDRCKAHHCPTETRCERTRDHDGMHEAEPNGGNEVHWSDAMAEWPESEEEKP